MPSAFPGSWGSKLPEKSPLLPRWFNVEMKWKPSFVLKGRRGRGTLKDLAADQAAEVGTISQLIKMILWYPWLLPLTIPPSMGKTAHSPRMRGIIHTMHQVPPQGEPVKEWAQRQWRKWGQVTCAIFLFSSLSTYLIYGRHSLSVTEECLIWWDHAKG